MIFPRRRFPAQLLASALCSICSSANWSTPVSQESRPRSTTADVGLEMFNELPGELALTVLSHVPVETLFNAVRFVSHSSNVLVHQLFLSSSYLNAVLDRFEPCFKLQLGLPHGPSRSDLFMSPSIILPRTGRDLSAVRMKMEGIYGGDVERIIVWIDGNYKPITSFQVTWLTRDPAKQHSKRAQEDVVTVSRGGWYEGDVDWFAIFRNMSKCRAREPGNYGEYLLFSPLGKAHGWSQNPLPSLLQRSERLLVVRQAVYPFED